MNLVDYSSSSDSEGNDGISVKRRKISKERLPLPVEIKRLENRFTDKPDDIPEKHDGRVRSFEHQRGNWASYVYIKVTLNPLQELQEKLVDLLQHDVKTVDSQDVHISLTKTIVLRHHWIESFTDSVREELNCFSEFFIKFENVNVYCNEDRTRTFIGLTIGTEYDENLRKIVSRLDKILGEYKLPSFYEEPSFHASILWLVGDHEAYITKCMEEIKLIFSQILRRNEQEFNVQVSKIYSKIGNKHYSFNIQKSAPC